MSPLALHHDHAHRQTSPASRHFGYGVRVRPEFRRGDRGPSFQSGCRDTYHNGSGDEVVAVAPARALSWHQVELPQGVSTSSTRLRAVLEGLLEERLLDDAENLHFALEPTIDPGLPFWVAVC